MIDVLFFLQEPAPTNYVAPFLKEGLLGVSVIVLCGVIYKMFKIILNDRDKAMGQRDALLEQIFTKVIPSLNLVTEFLEDRKGIDKESIQASRDAADALKENARVMQELLYNMKTGRSGGS